MRPKSLVETCQKEADTPEGAGGDMAKEAKPSGYRVRLLLESRKDLIGHKPRATRSAES